MTPSLSEQIGSHEAAKVLARKSINETLHELQTGAYTHFQILMPYTI